ncbi:MAG: HAD family hydrolase, partial [Alphaproteobacteria bacterium]
AMAGLGLRVIAFTRGEGAPGADPGAAEGLSFLGLVGLIDPPRPEVKAAVEAARRAGIRVIMVTGDGALTAQAIARQIGLAVDRPIEGAELDAMDDAALRAALEGEVLFARTTPAHKMRLVKALQARGEIVAMTGDGVNDAPALKQADIGIAMGMRGTDVARDAADLVLLDDNFATIVRAIREGRRQFENLRKFVRYLLSSNAGEVLAIVANLLMGGPLILLAPQILWMNLVTDGITAVALGAERATPGTMNRPPRAAGEGVIGRAGLAMILAFAAYTGLATLWVFGHFLAAGDAALARTAAFTAMIFFEKFSVFAFRSFHHANFTIGWFSNRLLIGALGLSLGAQLAAVYWPPLQGLLHTVPLGLEHWAVIGLLVVPLIVVPEAVKLLRRAG